MSRPVGSDGGILEKSDILSISYRISVDGVETGSGSIPLTAFDDTPWVTERWTRDAIGPTLMYEIPGTEFPDPLTEYLVIVEVTEVGGIGPYPVFWGHAFTVSG